MHAQLLRSGLLDSAHLVLGVDSTALTQFILTNGLDRSPSTILATGYFGNGAAQIQALREIKRANLPFAVLLEDDVELGETLVCELSRALQSPDLPDSWDVIYLSFEKDNCWPVIETNSDLPALCVEAAALAKRGGLVRLDGPCAYGNTRSYLVSNKGAGILSSLFFPLRTNVDALLREAIIAGSVEAFYLAPLSSEDGGSFLARSAPEARQVDGASQILHRYLKFEGDKVVVTFDASVDRGVDCTLDWCSLELEQVADKKTEEQEEEGDEKEKEEGEEEEGEEEEEREEEEEEEEEEEGEDGESGRKRRGIRRRRSKV